MLAHHTGIIKVTPSRELILVTMILPPKYGLFHSESPPISNNNILPTVATAMGSFPLHSPALVLEHHLLIYNILKNQPCLITPVFILM